MVQTIAGSEAHRNGFIYGKVTDLDQDRVWVIWEQCDPFFIRKRMHTPWNQLELRNFGVCAACDGIIDGEIHYLCRNCR